MSEDEIFDSTQNGRIVALRWDLLAWGLVLDLDAPVSEGTVPARRVWLVFVGLDNIFCDPLTLAPKDEPFMPIDFKALSGFRLPRGIPAVSPLWVTPGEAGFFEYQFMAQLAQYDHSDRHVGRETRRVVVVAQNLVGVCSLETAFFEGSERSFSRAQRNLLASDDELLLQLNQHVHSTEGPDLVDPF